MSKSDGRIHASNQRPFKPPFFFKYLSTQKITTDSKMENSWKGKIHTIYKRLWRKQKSRKGIHTRLRSRSWPKASCGGISSWSRRKQLAARSGESPLGWTVKCLRPCVVLHADGSSMELSYAVRVNKAMNSSLGNSSPGREQRDFNCPSQLILTFNYLKRKKSWVYKVFLIITKWWLYRIAECHRQGKDRGIAGSFIFLIANFVIFCKTWTLGP